MSAQQYSYRDVLAASERVNWRVEDLIGGGKGLDFGRPFLPESLARVEPLGFLTAEERLKLNQIRGHGYLSIFGLVEEFILPFVLDHARAHLDADDERVRALLRFAAEEAKHIHLFRLFRRDFEDGFGVPCPMIGPAQAVAEAVLAHHPLAVALAVLHIEWMTQAHYVESVKDDRALDPQFKSLLKHHWMEEAQHAKLDTLMVEALAEGMSAAEIEQAVSEYLEIVGFIDAGLAQQVGFDRQAFLQATGRMFDADEATAFWAAQHPAQRWTFLGSGMAHPNFLATLSRLGAGARARVEEAAPAYR